MPTGGIDLGVGALLTGALGATAGPLAADALVGAGGGALFGGGLSALEGGNVGQGILHGAEGGALTGGGIGVGGDLLGGVAGSVLGGAGGGALGGLVTGQGAGMGALEGAAAGGVSSVINGNNSLFGSTGTGSGTPGVNGSASGVSGGSGAGAVGAAAPSGVIPDAQFNNFLDATQASLQGSPATSPTGDGGGASQSFSANTGSPQTNSLINSFNAQQVGGAPVTDTLSPNVISASNAASPGGTDVSLNQPGALANLTGSQSPIAQSGAADIGAGAGTGGSGASATGAQPNSGVALGKSLFDGQTGTTGAAFNNFLSSNAGLAVPLGVMGYEAIESGKQPKGFNQLQSEAGQLAGQGAQLENYINTGTLPPGMQGAVAQNLAAQQAAIKSSYAARGMSGSSAEQQDLQNAAIQSQTQTAQLAESLLSQGVAETGDAAGIYQSLIGDIQKSDSGLSSALAAFAAASQGQGGQTGVKLSLNPATGQFQTSA